MTRYRSDISYELDDMSRVGFWTPETPEFLEKRDERRSAQRSSATSYTQAKANIRRISIQNQATSASPRSQSAHARIVDFGKLEHARPASDAFSFEAEWSWNGESRSGRVSARTSRRGKASQSQASAARRASASPAWEPDRSDAVRGYRVQEERIHGSRLDRVDDEMRFEEPLDEYESERQAGSSLRGRLDKARRSLRARKADRAFARNYAQAPATADEGPRAAVYEGRMGRRHQRAARMQDASRAGSGFQMPAVFAGLLDLFSFERLLAHRFAVGAAIAVMCMAFVVCAVYPDAQAYYLQVRANDQMAAEYQAVLERNGELEQHVAALQTDEGMEELAHESLGWVSEGEHSVSILTDGSSDPGLGSISATETVAEGSVPAPVTWYSPIFDVVFGYEG